MVGDCGQTRRLDNVQSLARGQSSAWMDITSMLVMDWTFWEAVHTGLQRQGKATSQEGRGCKNASDSVRDKDIRASEEFAREDSGEKGDEPRKRDHKPDCCTEYFLSIFRWVVLYGPLAY